MTAEKIVVLTGAGISAPSGLKTFRDSDGLWEKYRIDDVATPEGWVRNPQLVLEFYNARRTQACAAQPNAGHLAIAQLERRFHVVVVTQNVDDLHERAGSTKVIHLHGELTKARSTREPSLVYSIGAKTICIGDYCERGSQLRPHIVWFGEEVQYYDVALAHVCEADKLLVVGTSLSVFPAAGLAQYAPERAEKYLIDPNPPPAPQGFTVLEGSADKVLPELIAGW